MADISLKRGAIGWMRAREGRGGAPSNFYPVEASAQQYFIIISVLD